MQTTELREKTKSDLETDLAALRQEISELQIKHRAEGLANPNVIRGKKRDRARLLTVLNEKAILGD